MNEEKSFRDIIYTSDEEGHRKWVYAHKPSGLLYRYRSLLSYIYLAVFIILPFLKINGHPLFLFDVPGREFILFGVIFWPQDFFIFAIGMLTFMVFIVFFTVVYGRVFCGWACPQTIFMEMVFRKIEYWIEGSAEQQKRLDKQHWNREKILKKGGKHILFYAISFLISNLFLAYIIGVDELSKIIAAPVSHNIGGFFALLAFSGVFYAVFAFAREMVCTFACPYGRLQGVLLDKNSIVVAYDYKRGEPREKISHEKETPLSGDCIDCAMCVKVCPTGIDIRNGTQLECINCTACIDACDAVMEKVHRPKGLIRYASENNIANKQKLEITPRMVAYSAVLTALVVVLSIILVSREHFDASITRAQGQLYQKTDSTHYSNLYNIKLINKTHETFPVELRLAGKNGYIQTIGGEMNAGSETYTESSFFVVLDRSELTAKKLDINIEVYSGDTKLETVHTIFYGPLLKI
ncbi:MAG: cytochrome c oxidase accessory protein CcoG [Chitinophagales bacterium]